MSDYITRNSALLGRGADLWLVGIHAGAALAIAAFVAALTQAGGRGVMWTLVGTGVCILLLCLAGYFSRRRPLRRYRPRSWSTATASNQREVFRRLDFAGRQQLTQGQHTYLNRRRLLVA